MAWTKLMTTLGLLKIKIFQNKCFDVTTFVYEVINKSLICDSNYIVSVCSCDQNLVTLALL